MLVSMHIQPEAAEMSLVASPEPGWPQWRGPQRNELSTETGLLKSWPENGPKLLWKADSIGQGFSSPIISGDSIYITGDVGEQMMISALDLNGKQKWQNPNGNKWKKSFPGARSSCCYYDGLIYNMNAFGRITCKSAENGNEIWSVNVLDEYKAENLMWGLAEQLLVFDNTVIATPSGTNALMVAMERKTGKVLWTTDPIETEKGNYSSPILVQIGNKRQIITCNANYTFGIDPGTGKLMWKSPHEIPGGITTIPVLTKEGIFITNSSREEGRSFMLKIGPDSNSAEKIWTSPFRNHHGSVIFLDGALFGSSFKALNGWTSLNAESGEVRFCAGDIVFGSQIYADGCIYLFTEEGELLLISLDNNGFKVLSRFKLAENVKKTWAHPVILDGRLYVRLEQTLYCFDIRK